MLSKLQRFVNRARVDDSDGFTLIELLIVVVIIGILAAIAIPQFSSTKEQAYDATAKSDLRNLMTAQEGHFARFNQYATGIQQSGDATSTTLTFDGSDGVQENISLNTPNPALGYQASASHSSSGQCYGVTVGDHNDDGTDGAGEVTADGGNCGG